MRIDAPHVGDSETDDASRSVVLPRTWRTPSGLPFLGSEPPACSSPAARADFEAAAQQRNQASSVRACKRTCRQCPYMMACRDYAVTQREPWGIWGATTVRERAAEWNRRKRLRGAWDA